MQYALYDCVCRFERTKTISQEDMPAYCMAVFSLMIRRNRDTFLGIAPRHCWLADSEARKNQNGTWCVRLRFWRKVRTGEPVAGPIVAEADVGSVFDGLRILFPDGSVEVRQMYTDGDFGVLGIDE